MSFHKIRDTREQLAAEYATTSMAVMAARRGCTQQAISAAFRRLRIPTRPRGGDGKLLLRLERHRAATQRQLAERFAAAQRRAA